VNTARKLLGILIPICILAILMYIHTHPDGTKPRLARMLARAEMLGPMAQEKIITVTIGLPLRNEDALNLLLKQLSDPSSPLFRHYPTIDEAIERFCPTRDDYDRLIGFLTDKQNGAGLTVTGTAPDRLIVTAQGTVKQFEKLFSVNINRYNLMGQLGFSADKEPSLPANLRGLVQSVGGLNSFAQMRSHLIVLPRKLSFDSPFGYSPAQIAHAYNFPNPNNSTASRRLTGKKATIAIVTCGPFDTAAVNNFWKQYGIHRTGKLDVVSVGTSKPPTDFNVETTVDVEWAGAQAPDANIVVFECTDTNSNTFAVADNLIVCRNDIDVISVSWGSCEAEMGAAELQRDDNIFKLQAVLGMAHFAAAGDNGAYDCYVPKEPDSDNGKNGSKPRADLAGHDGANKPEYAVDSPASDPFVTAVGGTTIRLDDDGNRAGGAPETAWTGSGGGISSYFKQPFWQSGPGVPQHGMRDTCDMSLAAHAFLNGYSFYMDGSWGAVGGTSLGAPNAAAAWACIVEAAGGRVGWPNPMIYQIGNSPAYPTIFHDITSGDNGNGVGPGYTAGAGWDYPTGWGVPDMSALTDWVLAYIKPPPQASPSPARSRAGSGN